MAELQHSLHTVVVVGSLLLLQLEGQQCLGVSRAHG